MATTTTSTAAAAATTTSANSVPAKYRPVGVALAVGSGVLIGSSFVFKKKGLLSSQRGHVAGEGVAYLKSPLWWTGMTIMILGEICNLVAYSFLEAIIVTPMGALSVVVSAILSHLVLKEKLSLFGWISCIQCLIGATILALNGPQEQSVTTIAGFKTLFLAPGFLVYGAVVIVAALVLAFYAAPRWGQRSMFPHIGICSLIGGLSVSCTQGLGACIVTSIRGENQFKNWFIYFLLGFVVITLLTEVYYLNVALALFNTAMVTPTYYVMFTFCTLVTSVILYNGLKASAVEIMTVVLAFFIICSGIFILQMSKMDPRELIKDPRTSLLLRVARAEVDPRVAKELERELSSFARQTRSRLGPGGRQRAGTTSSATYTHVNGGGGGGDDIERLADPTHIHVPEDEEDDNSDDIEIDPEEEKKALVAKIEDPGIDALRGTFGAVGTIIRARKTSSMLALRAVRGRAASEGAGPALAAGARLRGVGSANGLGGGEEYPEKTPLRQEGHALSSMFAASPASQTSRQLSGASVSTSGGGRSAPVTLEHGNQDQDRDDPMRMDLAERRALTLPAVLKSNNKQAPFLDDSRKGHDI